MMKIEEIVDDIVLFILAEHEPLKLPKCWAMMKTASGLKILIFDCPIHQKKIQKLTIQ